MKNKGGPI